MKILILGGSGLVGQALIRGTEAFENIQTEATYGSRQAPGCRHAVEISQPDTVLHLVKAYKPDWVVSALRGDFSQQKELHQQTAQLLASGEGRMLFCSTTNVFDGDRSRAHDETEESCSVSDYGRFKAECEVMLEKILGDRLCIVRLPQIWGKGSPRMQQLSQLLSENRPVPVWPQLHISALPAKVVAERIIALMEQDCSGKVHLTDDIPVLHKSLIAELTGYLGFTGATMEDDMSEQGYFALKTVRKDLFKTLPQRSPMEILRMMVL